MASVPFDQLDGFIWMNGEFIPWGEAKIHVLTHGLHYASAVFEGERIYEGRVFRLAAHSARLRNSARLLDYELPWTRGLEHRGGMFHFRNLMEGAPGRRDNFQLSMGRSDKDFTWEQTSRASDLKSALGL